MRNRYGGQCYRCGELVEPGAGHFEKQKNVWLVQHASCAIRNRGSQDGRDAAIKREQDRKMVRDFFEPPSNS